MENWKSSFACSIRIKVKDTNPITKWALILSGVQMKVAEEKALELELHNKYRSQLQIRRLLRY